MLQETTDWNKTLIRCSSLGCLFTEPRSKADKDAGNLSETAKKHLVEVYMRELWGVEKQLDNKYVRKGITEEEAGITLLSRVDKVLYLKNEERKSNEWITGHCDILTESFVDDLKLSFDAFTFGNKLVESIDKDYEIQLQGYFWLYNRNQGRIRYALVDTPDSIVEGEKYRLLRTMDVATEESPEFKREWEKRKNNYYFNHIEPSLRVINHFVERDEVLIEKIPAKVERAREFLAEIHAKHTNQNIFKQISTKFANLAKVV